MRPSVMGSSAYRRRSATSIRFEVTDTRGEVEDGRVAHFQVTLEGGFPARTALRLVRGAAWRLSRTCAGRRRVARSEERATTGGAAWFVRRKPYAWEVHPWPSIPEEMREIVATELVVGVKVADRWMRWPSWR